MSPLPSIPPSLTVISTRGVRPAILPFCNSNAPHCYSRKYLEASDVSSRNVLRQWRAGFFPGVEVSRVKGGWRRRGIKGKPNRSAICINPSRPILRAGGSCCTCCWESPTPGYVPFHFGTHASRRGELRRRTVRGFFREYQRKIGIGY